MKNKHKVSSAVNFGGWGWFLVLICIVYQMMYSAFAVDGINGYGASLAAYLSQVSGTEITSDMLTAMLTPIGIICCLLGLLFTTLVLKKGTKLVAVVSCFGMAIAVFCFGRITNFTNYTIGLFFVQIFGTCLAFAVHHGFVGSWFPTLKGVVMGWTTMGLPLTSMILVPFVTWCFAGSWGWTGFCNALAVVLLVLGKSLGGGNNWFAGYGVFVVLCLIGAFVISRIDDKKESDDAAIEQELLAKAKSHSAK